MRDHKLYLDDILDSITKIESFIENVEYAHFIINNEKLMAVKFALLIIGEAANKIPTEIKDKYSEVPWKDIIGFRNKIAHDYFGLQVRIIWKIIKEDIPSLQRHIIKMLED